MRTRGEVPQQGLADFLADDEDQFGLLSSAQVREAAHGPLDLLAEQLEVPHRGVEQPRTGLQTVHRQWVDVVFPDLRESIFGEVESWRVRYIKKHFAAVVFLG